MDEDDFDFSDADLDDLPANALEQLETAAIRATQQHQHQHQHDETTVLDDSAYYGFFDDGEDDGGEVVNLDDFANTTNANADHGYAAPHPAFQPTAQQPDQHDQHEQAGGELEQPPSQPQPHPQSQSDVGRLLERIKKVKTAANTHPHGG